MKNNKLRLLKIKYVMSYIKSLILGVIVSCSLISCSNKKVKNDWTKDNLKGNVKFYTQTEYKAIERFGKVEPEKERGFEDNEQVNYDQNGNKTEHNWYTPKGDLFQKYIYKYDDKGNQAEENRYDSNGYLGGKYVYKYDDDNKIIETNYFKSNGDLFIKFTYKYDENGNKLESISHEPSGKKISKTSFKYDEYDNILEEVSHNSYGNLEEKRIYKYDENKNKIEMRFEADGIIYDKWSFSYYNYDDNGNWTKCITFKNGKPHYIRFRNYEYY